MVDADELSQREERLGRIVFAYVQALEAGEHPCRRQIVRQHPDQAAELEEFFDSEDKVRRYTSPLRQATAESDGAGAGATLGYFAGAAGLPVEDPARLSFGDYEFLEELGRGGMGVVYKARQKSLNRVVAVKMIRADRLASPTDLARFRNEAAAVAGLDHPNIAPIYEIGETEGRHYFAMKLVEGGNLSQHLGYFRDHPRAAAELLLAVAGAVCHAHRRGILHRDLKPSNILLDPDGRPYVTDFGLAKQLAAGETLTQGGELVGTPAYMAPEHVRGKAPPGPAMDIYGLGAVLYAMLTGRPPFEGETVLEVFQKIVQSDPAPPSGSNRAVDRDLQTICLKCLEKEPAKRYSCAGELTEDLQRWLAGQPIRARRLGRAARLWRMCRRHPAVATLSAVLCAAIVALVVSLAVSNANIRGAYSELEDAHQAQLKYAADLRRHLYGANIRLAQAAWKNAGPNSMIELLRRCEPAEGEEDLRGFEWRYLWRLAHGQRLTLRGHTGTVRSVAFSPDGRLLASAGADRTIILWDTADGRVRHRLTGHRDQVNRLCFSSNGALLASASDDHTARLWDVRSATVSRVLTEAPQRVLSVAFSPDGATFAVGGCDKLIRCYDLAGSKPIVVLKGHEDHVDGLAYSPNGKLLASASSDKTVRLWEAATGKPVAVLRAHENYVNTVAFSPDGSVLASGGSDNQLILWNVAGKREAMRCTGHKDSVHDLAFAPDGHALATACRDGMVRFFDIPTGAHTGQIAGDTERAWTVAFARDGRMLAAAGRDGVVRVWDRDAAGDSFPLGIAAHFNASLAFSPDGQQVFAGAVPTMCRLADNKVQHQLYIEPSFRFPATLALARSGRVLACGTEDGAIMLYSPQTLRRTAFLRQRGEGIKSLAFADDRLLATAEGGSKITLWDVAMQNPARVLTADADSQLDAVAVSPDGRFLAAADGRHLVRLWDLASGEPLSVLRGHADSATAVAFSPDGNLLASGSDDRTVRLWNPGSGELVGVLPGHLDSVRAVCFSPDGKRLASGSLDGTARIWDVATLQELLVLEIPEGRVRSLAFSPDGNALATGSHARNESDCHRSVRLWRAAPCPSRDGGQSPR